jgi:hypothetical protein
MSTNHFRKRSVITVAWEKGVICIHIKTELLWSVFTEMWEIFFLIRDKNSVQITRPKKILDIISSKNKAII